jgi:hypothetical protein
MQFSGCVGGNRYSIHEAFLFQPFIRLSYTADRYKGLCKSLIDNPVAVSPYFNGVLIDGRIPDFS